MKNLMAFTKSDDEAVRLKAIQACLDRGYRTAFNVPCLAPALLLSLYGWSIAMGGRNCLAYS